MDDAPRSVLDACALVALLKREPGAAAVEQVIGDGACVSVVNAIEVVTALSRRLPADQVERVFDEIHAFVVPMSRAAILDAGLLVRDTAAHGLGIGDRSCLAIARQLGARVVTSDRQMARADVGVEISLIR